jgi:hypothetical protein
LLTRRERAVAGLGAFIWIPTAVISIVILSRAEPGEASSPVEVLVAIIFILTWFLTVAAIVLMVKHVWTEANLSDGWRTAWTAILFLFNAFAAPFYWGQHMTSRYDRSEPPDPS